MALRQHLLIVGRVPAEAPGGEQPTFSKGVAFRVQSTSGSSLPPGEFPPAVAPLYGAGDLVLLRLTTPDGKAVRRELVTHHAGSPGLWLPGAFGEGSRIEYLDNGLAGGQYLAMVDVVDHLWEAGLPGPCPCGVENCGLPRRHHD